jgi:hypothetical protein
MATQVTKVLQFDAQLFTVVSFCICSTQTACTEEVWFEIFSNGNVVQGNFNKHELEVLSFL